ncbi:WD repeat-containing protein 24 [Schistosoma bovis]|uniref:GATOR2 complex protein WDR24 n=1 Tax=Schistosoma bovis TaxID=6184 RepID=A0A430QAL7_SCHBO|nr:WD repeat-containing protein 24 [Schistosoma bovis]
MSIRDKYIEIRTVGFSSQDIRDPNPISSCQIFFQRTASPSPVRDVSFCPKQGFLIAAAQENGVISIWDTRKGSRPFRAFQGHSCSIATLDWHPNWNMTQLVSSCNLTIDLSVHIWDLQRPFIPYVSFEEHKDLVTCNVHIWDLQRPFIPYVSFEEHKDLVTCISWCPAETNNFYTVGRDGLLIRHSVEDGVQPIENAPPVALSFSPYGHLLHAVRKDHVEINNKLSTVEENSKVSYPITTKNQPTSVQHSNGNGCSLSYYGPSYPTSTLSTATITTNTTSTNTTTINNSNAGDTLLSNKDFEHPTVVATSGNADELGTQIVTNTLILSESTVNIPSNNNNTIGTTAINPVTSTIFTNSTTNECTTITTTSLTIASPPSSPDLPQMGSLKSAQLFVSQAHSLLFHYKPCLELVRFWLLLRSIYGSLSSDPHKRTSSQQHATQTQPSTPSHQHQQLHNFSDLDNQYSKHIQSSLINEKFVPPTDSSRVHIPENKTLKCFRNSGALRRKKRDTVTNDTTGIKLSRILESLGIRSRESAQLTEKTKTNVNIHYRRHSSGNVRVQHHGASKQFIDTLPPVQKFLSCSSSANNDPTDCVFSNIPSIANPYNNDCSTLTNDLLFRSTKPISLNMDYDSLHKPLVIDNDQLIPSLSSSASPPISQPSQFILKSLEDDILNNGLLFHNYHEDIDYLFHTTSPQEPLEPSPFIENDPVKRRPDQLDLIEVIGSHDDPVIMETDYLPDEAFVTNTNTTTAVNITPEIFQNSNQLQYKQKESCLIHNQKRQLMKQNTVECSTKNDQRQSTSITTNANDNCKVVSCCVDIPVSRKNHSSSKLQRKSMDCSKLLASNCHDLSLIDRQNSQILSASSFPGLYTASSTIATTVPLNNDVDCTPLIPSFHSNDAINQEIKKCSDETLVKNDDEHDEYNCPLISQSLLSSSPSQSNTSSLAKQKLLGTCKKSVQLLAPPHHSKSLSGFSRESSMLLNGYTVNSVGSLSPISGDINSIICKWLIKLVESGHVQTVCTALLALGPERLRLSEWISESILEHWFISYLELLSRFRLWTVCARIIKQCGNPFAGADNQTYLRERLRSINHHYVFRPIVMKQPESESKTSGNTGDTRSDVNTRTRWKSGGLTCIDNPFVSRLNNMSLALAPGVAALNQASTTLSIRCGLCTKPLCASETTQQLTGHSGWACSRHATSFDPATITCALCHLVVRGLFVCCRGCSHGGHLDHMQAWLMKRSECPTGCGHRCKYD